MAIAIEFVNVIVPKQAIQARYEGGLDAYAVRFIEQLSLDGLRYADHPAEIDVCIVEGFHMQPPCEWLSIGDVDGVRAVWMRGSDPGELIELPAPFLLCCPANLYAVLVGLMQREGISATARNPPAESVASWSCARGSARLNLDVWSIDQEMAVINGCRDPGNREFTAEDIRFSNALQRLLVRYGATFGPEQR